MRPKTVAAGIAALLVAGATYAVPGAAAAGETCQGKPATIVGPTSGKDTVGTEGDDVMVAPATSGGFVQGLGGNDTICLVQHPTTTTIPFTQVDAGPGNDSVLDQEVLGYFQVSLGAGSDTFQGDNSRETVLAGSTNGSDVDHDAIDAGGGSDTILTGEPGVANTDAISTGVGDDTVQYAGAAGGHIDDGPDPDTISFVGPSTSDLRIDNGTGTATSEGSSVLTWTAAHGFGATVAQGGSVSFNGTDADERLFVSAATDHVTAPGEISTGAGDDAVSLVGYLPAGVDAGSGTDSLFYVAGCKRVLVRLASIASCAWPYSVAFTRLAGVEGFSTKATQRVSIYGSSASERLSAIGRFVSVRAGAGDDRIDLQARYAFANGGDGNDKVHAVTYRSSYLRGGAGDDLLGGGPRRDNLVGDEGDDVANGKGGAHDSCLAEVTVACERP